MNDLLDSTTDILTAIVLFSVVISLSIKMVGDEIVDLVIKLRRGETKEERKASTEK